MLYTKSKPVNNLSSTIVLFSLQDFTYNLSFITELFLATSPSFMAKLFLFKTLEYPSSIAILFLYT